MKLAINSAPFADETLSFDPTVIAYVEEKLGIDINLDDGAGRAEDDICIDGADDEPTPLLLGLLGLEGLPCGGQASPPLRNVIGLVRHLQLPLDGIAFAPGNGVHGYLKQQSLGPADAPTAVALLAFLAAKDVQLATRVARALQPHLVAE